MKGRLFWTCLILVIVPPALVLAATREGVTVTDSSPVEAKLAAIHSGSNTVPQSLVRSYRVVLTRLRGKCKVEGKRPTKMNLADMSVFAVQDLKKRGKKTTPLEFLEGMEKSIPAEAKDLNLECAEVAALLLTMM